MGEPLRMTGVHVEALLRLPVLLRGIRLGQPVDVIFDRERTRAIGLEVHCGDELRRFLALSVVRIGEEAIHVTSPLVLVEQPELAFYAKRGATLSGLRRSQVLSHGTVVGTLEDVVLADDGTITELVVRSEAGRQTIPYGARVELALRAAS